MYSQLLVAIPTDILVLRKVTYYVDIEDIGQILNFRGTQIYYIRTQ